LRSRCWFACVKTIGQLKRPTISGHLHHAGAALPVTGSWQCCNHAPAPGPQKWPGLPGQSSWKLNSTGPDPGAAAATVPDALASGSSRALVVSQDLLL